jgi:hypothetical protein
MALQDCARESVSLLQVDAPVFQLVERNVSVGDGATNKGSRRDHPEIAVEILHPRFALAGIAEFIQHR